jgi:hypothetical protein
MKNRHVYCEVGKALQFSVRLRIDEEFNAKKAIEVSHGKPYQADN